MIIPYATPLVPVLDCVIARLELRARELNVRDIGYRGRVGERERVESNRMKTVSVTEHELPIHSTTYSELGLGLGLSLGPALRTSSPSSAQIPIPEITFHARVASGVRLRCRLRLSCREVGSEMQASRQVQAPSVASCSRRLVRNATPIAF